MIHNIGDDTEIRAVEHRENFAVLFSVQGLNTIRQLQDRNISFSLGEIDGWGEAYSDSNGRINSVDADNTSAEFLTDKYAAFDEASYVIIEASSLTESDFSINDCVCSQFGTGMWLLSCSTGTDEVKRAQIYKTLFYGSDGSNPRASSTYITGISALKTSVTRDVGTQAYYHMLLAASSDAGSAVSYTGTFSNTTTNYAISTWASISSNDSTNNSGVLYLPDGVSVYSSDGDPPVDYFGTDRTSVEKSNSADTKIAASANSPSPSSSYHTRIKTLILSKGSISYGFSVDTADSGSSYDNELIDFTVDNGMPVFTAAVLSDVTSIVTHNIPSGTFGSTVNSCFGTPKIEDFEDGATIDYKLSNGSDDTGWLTSNEISEFTAFTSEPTTLVVRINPKSSSPTTNYPSINGFWVIAR